MDQDDLEDELIWKTLVAHFDMASEKVSYRLRGALGSAEAIIALTLGAVVIVGWVLRSSRKDHACKIQRSGLFNQVRLKLEGGATCL